MAVKNINDQPVKTPTYLWGVDEVGLACRATPYVSPVLSVVGLTGEITQAGLRTALGLGTAAYINVASTGNASAAEIVKGNDTRLSDARTPVAHTHAAANISDSTVTGRAVLTATDQAAARTAIGVGTSSTYNVAISGNAASGEVVKGDDTRLSDARTPTAHNQTASTISDSTATGRALMTAADAATARSTIGAAPTDSPTFTTNISTPAVNGAATSGFRNKIINGCMRISKKGNGAAALGENRVGADGIITYIGGWSAISGAALTRDTLAANDGRFSTGAVHCLSMDGATGGSGFVILLNRIEAADVQELGGKVVTAAARLHAWATAPSNYYLRIYKANAVNDFSAGLTLISQSASFGSLAVNTTVAPSHTFTIPAGDCLTGLQVELVVHFTGAVAASTSVFFGDFQFCEGSKAMPFELRPIAIEEQLRRRYYQKQSVMVNTSSNWTCFPIGMVRTPTITGGGSGFTSTGTTADTLMCYQTTAAAQTLILDAEL